MLTRCLHKANRFKRISPFTTLGLHPPSLNAASQRSFTAFTNNHTTTVPPITQRHYGSSSSRKRKTTEQIYQRKTPIEHVLDRPDTYVGSVQRAQHVTWVLEGWENHSDFSDVRIVSKEVSYVPALYKIIDELLVNAVDNHNRPGSYTDALNVEIDHETGWIHIYNNGQSVPVVIHQQENMYVPELVFGHLLTGSNFDDQESKLTGGRNGYGAKLANIFSREFRLEIADPENGKLYKQRWTKNMSACEPAEITSLESSHTQQDSALLSREGYIKISVLCDFERFGMTSTADALLDGAESAEQSGILQILYRRVFDLAACNPKLRVTLNNRIVPVHNFMDYIQLFFKQPQQTLSESEVSTLQSEDVGLKKTESTSDTDQQQQQQQQHPPVVYYRLNPHWEIAVGVADEANFSHVSFVNSIATFRGGSHVQLIADRLTDQLTQYINNHIKKSISTGAPTAAAATKTGFGSIAPAHVKNHLSLFVNCLVENPTFDSQVKETLTSKTNQISNGKYPITNIPQAFIEELAEKTDLVETIISYATFRRKAEMDKKQPRRSRLLIPKLEDANLAGTAHSHECTLILTEGDSAKALAMSGLSVLGRDRFGVFPLRGKLLNVREATHEQLASNEEINNIRTILGLKFSDSDISSTEGLRYGRVMLMCDQDYDGSHIKGLFMNIIHHFWPKLLATDFLEEFITPIVKAIPKGTSNVTSKKALRFYTIPEYENWRKSLPENEADKWRIKYYKGLGTSTAAEAKEYFGELEKHRIRFTHSGPMDDQLIDMVFSKHKADDRKLWLQNTSFTEDTHADHSTGSMEIGDFINKELVLFSNYNNIRSIPSAIDGLKPGQRKVLFASFKRNLTNEIKVAQLAGYVAEHSAYHHGEVSLHSTIINMAQDFVGSNNLPLLLPIGQFGTRLEGGKDSASARYIFTRLSPVTRLVFPPEDDAVLEYLEDDGEAIEPKYYLPIIPMVLVNGAIGMGTGWSTHIPTYNPVDVIDNLIRKMDGTEPMQPMKPWARGWKGSVTFDEARNSFVTRGVIELPKKSQSQDKESIIISELPQMRWTSEYKAFLQSQMAQRNGLVKKVTEHNTDTQVHFVVRLNPLKSGLYDMNGSLNRDNFEKLYKKLRLESSISLSNMTLFDSNRTIKRYNDPLEVIEDFFTVRLQYYEKRKAHLVQRMEQELTVLANQLRFVNMVSEQQIAIFNQSKQAIVDQLVKLGFYRNLKSTQASSEAADDSEALGARGFEYLLNISLFNLSKENAERLSQNKTSLEQQLHDLQQKSLHELWKADLLKLRKALEKMGGYC